MSALSPAPAVSTAPAPVSPSKAKSALRAFVSAVTSPTALKLELALGRYVGYAVLAAFGVHHASDLGL